MVRVIGGGAAGARRLLRTLQRIALLRRLQARRAMLLLRTEAGPHRRLARTLRHARRPDAPAATAADADRPASPRCCSAADAADPNGRCPCGRARLPVAACGGRGGAGGTTRGGCGTSCRFGCSGGALGGALPGSSTRRRMLGGTKRPAAFSRAARRFSAAAALPRQPASRPARGSATAAAPRQPARAPTSATRRRLPRPAAAAGASTGGGDGVFGRWFGRLRLLDQARRTERRRGRLRRLRRGRSSALLAGRGLRLRASWPA